MTENPETLPVLIVDDELDIREGSERILKRMGFDVTTAANGEEGLEKFSSINPAIVLLDLKMPKRSIYISLERRMKCGIGKCGHCQMEGIYVCQEGPVFNYSYVANNKEIF